MRWTMRWKWVAAATPAIVGLVAYLILFRSRTGNLFIQIDGEIKINLLIFVIGLLISALLAIWVFMKQRAQQKQQQIRTEAVEDRRRFLRRLDHELKNPLTAILAGLATLAAQEDAQPSMDNTNSTILKNVQTQSLRLSSLVGDLRKLSDLENLPLEVTTVNLTELLEDAFAQIQSQQAQTQDGSELNMRLTLPTAWPPLPDITGDEDLLFLAVLNLLQNAVKFSHASSNIELSAFGDGDTVLIKVADTGPGIPEAEVPHVWDELYRGKETQSIEGSGLGMTFVRTIVKRHQGEVSIISRPREGTEVTMRFPIAGTSA